MSQFYNLFFLVLLLSIVSCDQIDKEKYLKNSSATYEKIERLYYSESGLRDSIRRVIKELPDDSLKLKLSFNLSYHYLKENDSLEFFYWNKFNFDNAEIQNDSLRIGETFWDLGSYYGGKEQVDSAYFYFNKALAVYSKLEDKGRAAKMLLNLANIQKNVKDYTGSEITTIKAISFLQEEENGRDSYIGMTNLGIIYNQLSEYEQSIKYHKEALRWAKELKAPMLEANTLNNLGVVYENLDEFSLAIEFFKRGMEIDSLYAKNRKLYAMLKDNLAYSIFRSDKATEDEILPNFEKALKIRDSIDHKAGIVINKIHLSEFYLKKGDSAKASTLALESNKLAEETRNHRDFLASLLLLSRTDKQNEEKYLRNYIQVHDRLQKEERVIRNKFARIKFETDRYIAKNESLSEQRNWIIAGSGGLFSVGFLLFVIWWQRSKNKELRQEQEQQLANEQIYTLMLDQESRSEKGRHQEKIRISRELHDGVLSNLYGIRFNLTNLNSKNDSHSVKLKEGLLNNLRKIEEEIRQISRDLQKNKQLMELGFLNLVENYIQEQVEISGMKAFFLHDASIQWETIGNKVKMNLFRIIQESIRNIQKYSEASEFRVNILLEEKVLLISVIDNGNGFKVAKNYSGIGLKNMKARAETLNGVFKVTSNSSGTKIEIKIPVTHGKKN